MACEVRILPSAEKEVEEIVAYLMGRSEGAARRFVSAYRDKLEMLASGSVDFGLSHLPELAELGYHAFRAASYVVLCYRDENGGVVVAHVFHQRNYARLVLPPRRGGEERMGSG